MIVTKCISCKKVLTEQEIDDGFCSSCDAPVQNLKNILLAVCPECGKKLENEDFKNAYRTCCPFCMTVIEID